MFHGHIKVCLKLVTVNVVYKSSNFYNNMRAGCHFNVGFIMPALEA